MGDKYIIKALQRDTKTKSISKRLINNGYALATMYGREQEYSIAVDRREFNKIFYLAGQHDIITLDIENDKAREVFIKDYQIDIIKRTIRHIDFYEIDRHKKIKTNVNIRLEGIPEGVRISGGTMEQVEHVLRIRALPEFIPRELVIDVTDLKVGSSLHVKDIKFPEGVEPLGDFGKTIVTIVSGPEEESK